MWRQHGISPKCDGQVQEQDPDHIFGKRPKIEVDAQKGEEKHGHQEISNEKGQGMSLGYEHPNQQGKYQGQTLALCGKKCAYFGYDDFSRYRISPAFGT